MYVSYPTRFHIIYLFSIQQKSSAGAPALRQPYLRVVHLELASGPSSNSAGASPFGARFSPQEEEEFGEMARSEGFYERFANSVAPSIFGNLGDPVFSSVFFMGPFAKLTHRYQESDHMFAVRGVKKDPPRRYATERRHQCALAG